MTARKLQISHPGEILRAELMDAGGLTVTEIAVRLQVSRQAISNIVNKRADISPEMAVRIATVFGGNADIWLRLQAKYDLEIAARKVKELKLTPYRPGRSA